MEADEALMADGVVDFAQCSIAAVSLVTDMTSCARELTSAPSTAVALLVRLAAC